MEKTTREIQPPSSNFALNRLNSWPQAVGFLRGTYLPSDNCLTEGILLTEDRRLFPATLHAIALETFKMLSPDEQGQFHSWVVWIRTNAEEPKMQFVLKRLRDDLSPSWLDHFQISGLLHGFKEEENRFKIRVRPHKHHKVEPFLISINGMVPDKTIRLFYNCLCRRQGDALHLEEAVAVPFEPQSQATVTPLPVV